MDTILEDTRYRHQYYLQVLCVWPKWGVLENFGNKVTSKKQKKNRLFLVKSVAPQISCVLCRTWHGNNAIDKGTVRPWWNLEYIWSHRMCWFLQHMKYLNYNCSLRVAALSTTSSYQGLLWFPVSSGECVVLTSGPDMGRTAQERNGLKEAGLWWLWQITSLPSEIIIRPYLIDHCDVPPSQNTSTFVSFMEQI
jgi:hypothetical protein